MINIFKKIKMRVEACSPHKILFTFYIIILVTIVGLYKWQPISPILMVPNIILSDWSHQPVSCWDILLMDDKSPKKCELDDDKGNILLFGDSHAQQLVFGFERLERNFSTSSSKKLIFLTSQLMRGNWRSSIFHEDPQVRYIRSTLAETTEKDVIIFSITSGHVEDSVYGNLKQKGRLQVDLAELLASIFYSHPIKGNIVLMLDTPHLKNNVARICSGNQGVNKKLCRLKFDDYERQNGNLVSVYDQLNTLNTTQMWNPTVLNPAPLFCRFEQCSLFDESGFMLIDGNHIKMSVSHKLVEEFFFEII